ncbi:uncharacterized protein LOC101855352 [Aplysia californica]|uniref:Uncharacterized protein LOC101855352 n=1 Tax=Aplysia californica TaxID=6500 RepID=A0ABM0JVL5_APLCA|nr:uncharacterized protein LOC101855352 [Aplysia californica]
MEDDDWEPLGEADMKLIQARRERSDKISKLMGDYLLKGYKMLATTCPECGTILLQTRQGQNYCVACSELNSDVGKDDPVLSESAALSMARELELASAAAAPASATAKATTGTASGDEPSLPPNSVPTVTPLNLGGRPVNSARSRPNTSRSDLDQPNSAESCHTLSMTSIDVQCWPANASDVRSKKSAPSSARSLSDIKVEPNHLGADGDSGLGSLSLADQAVKDANGLLTAGSQSPFIQTLVDKVQWASQELKKTHSVEYSIQLCQLIKTASEAVVAVRTARI